MGFFAKFFGPSFKQSCDRLADGAYLVFQESDRVCENIVDTYNEEVSLGQRGIDRRPIKLSQTTLLGWKCAGLVPLLARLRQLHPSEKEKALRLTGVYISGLGHTHPAAALLIKKGDDYNPFRNLILTCIQSPGDWPPLDHGHIIDLYKLSLSKLIGRAEDVSDLISRSEKSNMLLSKAITALVIPSKVF